jgi:capsular polysaccharide biosynthesis protein
VLQYLASEFIVRYHDGRESFARGRLKILFWLARTGRTNVVQRRCPTVRAKKIAVTLYQAHLATSEPRLLEGAVDFLRIHQRRRTSDRRAPVRRYRTKRYVVQLKGWAANVDDMLFPSQFYVTPKAAEMSVKKGVNRADVAIAHANPRLNNSGFEVSVTFEKRPVKVDLSAEIDGRRIEVVPTQTVSARYGAFVSNPTPQDPPLLAYLDAVDFNEKVRTRPAFFAKPQSNRPESLDLSLLELELIVGDSVDVSERFAQSGSSMTRPGTDFRIDRLRFMADRLVHDAKSPFIELGWKTLNSSGETFRGDVVLAQSVLQRHSRTEEERRTFNVVMRSPLVEVLRNVLHVHGHLIVSESRELLLADHAARPDLDFVAGQWDIVHGSHLRRDRAAVLNWGEPTIEVDRAASITGRVGFNYFHSMVEYLPRLNTLERYELDEDVPIIVNGDLLPTAKDALHRIVGDRDLIELKRNDVARFDTLYVPHHHTNHRDSTSEPWWKGAGMYWPVIDEFRNQLIATVQHQPTPKRVFFVRSADSVNGRGLRNQDELIQIAEQFGFDSVDPGKLDLDGQINIIRNAEIIVGPGGASMANLMFGHENLKVLVLVSDHLHDFAMFSTLAHHAGAQYFTLTGPSNRHLGRTEFHRDVFHGDFWISPRKFRSVLTSLVG